MKEPIPDTISEMIDFLKQFPKDWKINLFYSETSYYGGSYDTSLYKMRVDKYDTIGEVNLTFK